MKQGYVIGGIWRFIEQNIAPMLAEYGIEVDRAHHHEMSSEFRGPIPADTEVVIVFEEMVRGSSESARHARHLARAKGIPCITGTRHKSHLHRLMEQYGFRPVLSPAGVAVLLAEETKMSKQTSSTPAPVDIEAMGFEALKQMMGRILRTARDRHGLTEVMWSRDTGLEMKRVTVVSDTLEV